MKKESTIECASKAPKKPDAGQIYFDEQDRRFYGFDGKVWKPLSM